MQEAIRNYIELNREAKPIEQIHDEINKVTRAEIKTERQKQLRLWRRLNATRR